MENSKDFILEILDYIEQHLEEALNLDSIARVMGYSKFHLNRMFSEQTGCTIYKYIKTARLNEAARKLIETDIPIIEIAQEANYNSQQSFTLAFKKLYFYPPQAYRSMGVFLPKRIEMELLMIKEQTANMETYHTNYKMMRYEVTAA